MRASMRISMTLLGTLLLFGACTGPGNPKNMISYYTLEYEPPEPSVNAPLPVVVRMERFSVSPVYNGTAIIYRNRSYERSAYVYYRWRANPGQLVSQFLGRDLRMSGLFKGVVPDGSRLRGSYVMEGSVEEFLESDHQDRWDAVLTVNIILLAEDEPDVSRRVVFQKSYRVINPCRLKHPSALAEAMSHAMRKFSEDVRADVYDRLAERISRGTVR